MALSGDILRSWRAPGEVMREHLARGEREDRALMFLGIACVLIFVAQWPRLARQAQLDESVPLQGLIAGALMGWLFIAPLLLYGLAALLALGMRLIGQRIGGYPARLALFWSLLAVSPVWMLHGLVAGLAGPGAVSTVVGLAALAAFFWLLGAALRTAALEARAGTA